jgi:predicted dehydrogenase
MKQPFGVLLVTGMQTHQENYADAFAADPRCKIVAVCDEAGVDAAQHRLNEQLAQKHKVEYVPDLGKALARKDVDLVSVCAQPERRGRIALECAKAGKHLYLDKSLAPRLEEADALVREVKKQGVRSHMFTFISTAWAQAARKLVDAGGIGEVLAVHADVFFAKGKTGTAKLGTPRKEEYPPGRHQLREAKREWDNVGVYPITMVAWLTGRKFKRVHGVTGNYFFAEHQKHDVEDFGLLSGTLEGDIPVTISGGRYGWTTHPSFGTNRTLVVGSKGTLVVTPHQPRIEVYSDAPPWTPPARPHPDDPMGFWSSTQDASGVRAKEAWVSTGPSGQSDASYFLDCLSADRESELSVVEAAHATEVLLATYLSANRHEVVELPLVR